MQRPLLAVAIVWLASCSSHMVFVGADAPAVAPHMSDAGIADAHVISARDAGNESVDAALSRTPHDANDAHDEHDAASAPPPLHCTGSNADCDADAGNGCEADLTSDPKHCGSCGVACQSPDCACRDGMISVVCPAGRADCDGDSRNGCEVDIDTSMQNCGRCGRLCHTMGHDALEAVCVAGHCKITCQIEPFGQGDCDDNPDNGCETNLWTNENCGMCGVRCTCVDGKCT